LHRALLRRRSRGPGRSALRPDRRAGDLLGTDGLQRVVARAFPLRAAGVAVALGGVRAAPADAHRACTRACPRRAGRDLVTGPRLGQTVLPSMTRTHSGLRQRRAPAHLMLAVAAAVLTPAGAQAQSLPRAQPNDLRAPAGRMVDGELRLALDAVAAECHPPGPHGPRRHTPASPA